MSLADRAVLPLRIFLVMLFAVLVVFQTMSLPGQFRYMAQEQPDLAYLRWPATAVTVFWVLLRPGGHRGDLAVAGHGPA